MSSDHYTKQNKIRQQVPLGYKDTLDSKKTTEYKYDASEGKHHFTSELSPHVMSARGKSPNETRALIWN
jgi:hypothetical protein